MANSLGLKIFNHNYWFTFNMGPRIWFAYDFELPKPGWTLLVVIYRIPMITAIMKKTFILICNSHTTIIDTIRFDSNISFLWRKSYSNHSVIITLMNAWWHKPYIGRVIGTNCIQKITGSWKYDPESMTLFITIQSRIISVFITSFLSYIYLNYIFFDADLYVMSEILAQNITFELI